MASESGHRGPSLGGPESHRAVASDLWAADRVRPVRNVLPLRDMPRSQDGSKGRLRARPWALHDVTPAQDTSGGPRRRPGLGFLPPLPPGQSQSPSQMPGE